MITRQLRDACLKKRLRSKTAYWLPTPEGGRLKLAKSCPRTRADLTKYIVDQKLICHEQVRHALAILGYDFTFQALQNYHLRGRRGKAKVGRFMRRIIRTRTEGGAVAAYRVWMSESDRTFGRDLPAPAGDSGKSGGDREPELLECKCPKVGTECNCLITARKPLTWMQCGSWTFCATCGIRRPDGKFVDEWDRTGEGCVQCNVCVRGCDLKPSELERAPDSDAIALAKESQTFYVTPAKEDWPQLKDDGGKEVCAIEALTETECRALEIIRLDVDAPCACAWNFYVILFAESIISKFFIFFGPETFLNSLPNPFSSSLYSRPLSLLNTPPLALPSFLVAPLPPLGVLESDRPGLILVL